MVFLFWCGGVFLAVWWCGGVFVVTGGCGGVCVVVFLWWCFCGGGGVFEVFLCFCDGVFVCFFVKGRLSSHYREVLTTLV